MLTSVVAIPAIVGVLYYGSPKLFLFFLAAVILGGVYEYFSIIDRIGISGFPIPGMILSFLLLVSFYFDGNFILGWGLVASITLFATWFLQENNIKIAIDQISFTLFGILYVAGLGGYYILIRNLEGGGSLIFFLLLITWLGDTAAYYWGKNYGKKPLAPIISPNKTVEGAVAGLVGSLAAGVVGYWFLGNMAMVHCLLLALICGTIGQFGDLAESLLKRHAGIKNSGNLLPGHGGILDRIDGLLLAGPTFYCYLKFVF